MSKKQTLEEARKFVNDVGDQDLADRLGEKLNDRRDTVRTVVELKNLIEKSESAGLGDDPAVEELRQEVERLAEDAGIAVSQTAAARLSEEYGLDQSTVERLHEDDREKLLEHLSVVDEVESSSTAPSTTVGKHVLNERRQMVEELLDHNEVKAAALAGGDTDDAADTVAGFLADLDPEGA